ncbi:MAG: thiazole synthase, partial [Desulfobacteraceae bacterium]|nr:thiazole synthase [Desulfobacteraceae bacterium]
TSSNPPDIALAFSMAVKAGRKAFLAKMEGKKVFAEASSPLTGFLGES